MVFVKRKFNGNFSANTNYMDDLYAFHDELGSGGFGKVKLATHLLTGERVAIKIIDKKAIGDDLPRVTTELEALKHLAHQNICRMFQYVETDDKFYIVMEYCNGGEMFDYIVRKERLEESEARHFFRQLVQAIAYVHSMGFAHRDLKPENLLLKEDLQLKVIDFGLCARPRNGLTRQLETCCGSPAYAAPELVQNSAYYGNEADVWSMGVLLYALLCGALPFEDESMPKLYKKIMQGVYHEPTFLSTQSKELLRAMLTVNPKRRIGIKELLVHPWLNKNYQQPLKFTTIYDRNVIDEDVARELAYFYSMSLTETISLLKERATQNIVCSPTIHASLETDLHRSGVDVETEDTCLSEKSSEIVESKSHDNACYDSPFEKSYAKAIDFGSPLFFNSPQQQLQKIYCRTNPNPITNGLTTNQKDTPKKKPNAGSLLVSHPHHYSATDNKQHFDAINKENVLPATLRPTSNKAVIQALAFTNGADDNGRPKSVYSTPRRAPITGIFSPALYRRPKSMDREPTLPSNSGTSSPIASASCSANASPLFKYPGDVLSNDSDTTPTVTDVEILSEGDGSGGGNGRVPRSQVKTPRLRQRVFKSLERKADKMINLLTPRKMRADSGPTKLKCIKTMVNVSVTSSNDPNKVRSELLRVLLEQGLSPIQNGWKISGSKRNANGMGQTTVELEVVLIESLDYVGVKRRRLNGDAFLYKKVCEEVLRMAGL